MLDKFDQFDSIMADKGFNVQDLFAPRDVHVNIPTFFSKKNRMTGEHVARDRKISSKRVHIERIIGQALVNFLWPLTFACDFHHLSRSLSFCDVEVQPAYHLNPI